MIAVELEAHELGVVLPVRAKPASRRNALEGTHGGALRIAVTAAPEKGRANKAILELLAKALGVKKSSLQLLTGDTSPQKRILICGVTVGQVREKLSQQAGP